MNHLYFGDNLDILRRHIKDGTVDLVYLDPPFNSNREFNILFREQTGNHAKAQVKAFEDTWQWGNEAAEAYQEVVEGGHHRVSEAMQAFRRVLGEGDMLAYLSMMAPRLVELRRVMKATGSIYLHCDPTASHYLKALMDAVFDRANFRTEVIWRRTNAKGLAFKGMANNHDIILYYTQSDKYIWNQEYTELDPAYVERFYRYVEPETGRRYQLADLVNPNRNRPNLTYEFLGVTRVWRWTKERMEKTLEEGRIVQTKPGTVPRYKRYLDESKGTPVDSIWTDIKPIPAHGAERLGFPTQKPMALLERIIKSSSDKGEVVLDPFCGCGTAIVVAQSLARKWIGIDITHIAIALVKHRLKDMFGGKVRYKTLGEPVSVSDAHSLAKQNAYQFQWWALGLVGARPVEEKKGADKGIDGRIYFHDSKGRTNQIVLSVKSGHVSVRDVRDLRGVVDRKKAQIGVLITMESAARPMLTEAASAGFFKTAWGNHPMMQVLTIDELLQGKQIDCPPTAAINITFKNAKPIESPKGEELHLNFPRKGNA